MSADVSGITFRISNRDSRIIRTMTRDDGFHAARRSRSRFERDESEMRHRHPRTAPRTHGMTMRAIRDARGRATAGRWQQSPVHAARQQCPRRDVRRTRAAIRRRYARRRAAPDLDAGPSSSASGAHDTAHTRDMTCVLVVWTAGMNQRSEHDAVHALQPRR